MNRAILLCLAAVATVARAAESPAPPGGDPVDYLIVVTGAEILAGAYPDGHTHFLTRTLYPLGLHCIGSLTVDDRHEDIEQALRFSNERAEFVIVTGGLGPTNNDVTRQSLSDITRIPLEEQQDVIAGMERRFNTTRDQLRANLRRQAQVPVHGTYLQSASGTAVGLVFDTGRQVVVALPGPPRELQPMVRDALVPYLNKRFGTRLPGCSLTIRFVGLGQSQIDQTLDERVPLPPGTAVSSQFEGGRVDFGFLLPGDSPAERTALEDLKQRIRRELGEYVYAEDATTTLEDHVAQLLEKQNDQLAFAEVGSSGSLAASLSASTAGSRVLAGAFVGASNDQLRQLLSVADAAWQDASSAEQRVRLLTEQVAARSQCPWAIGVGEVEVREGSTSVLFALRAPDGDVHIQRLPATVNDPARGRLITTIWDQLRRRLTRSGSTRSTGRRD